MSAVIEQAADGAGEAAIAEPLIRVRDLSVHYPLGSGLAARHGAVVKAVDRLRFDIHRGETLGLVGESGCGKSTTGRALLFLTRPTDGRVIFDGKTLSHLSPRELRGMRQRMQMIFQDPYASLNPRMTVADLIGEPLVIHGLARGPARRQRVEELLDLVGLPRHTAQRYPHEFSGGQRQRVGIARALAVNPDFIVCDESIAALDVSIQAQIVNLLEALQQRLGLTYLFISHDLAVVRHVSDRVAVMYRGRMVELGDRDSLFERPLHPYTRSLLAAVPVPDPLAHHAAAVATRPSGTAARPDKGCIFRLRCPLASIRCEQEEPELIDQTPTHASACFNAGEFATRAELKLP